jgi:hypothetical protein
MRCLVVFGLVAACLALAGAALAQASDSPPPAYVVEPAEAAGGGYRLTGLAWRIDAPNGETSGGRYRLLCASSRLAAGSGCCCIYLPLVTRNWR